MPIDDDKKRPAAIVAIAGITAALIAVAIVLLVLAPWDNPACDLNDDDSVDILDTVLLTGVVEGKRDCPAGKDCDLDASGAVDRDDVAVLADVVLGGRYCPGD